MMTRYLAAAFVAVSALLSPVTSGWAHGPAGGADPAAPDHALAWFGERGTASFYGPGYHGRRAADGSRFDQNALTAAHPWLPFGTRVRVSLLGTGRSVIVTITDRLSSSRRIVDLSVAAARQLGMIRRGLGEVRLLPA